MLAEAQMSVLASLQHVRRHRRQLRMRKRSSKSERERARVCASRVGIALGGGATGRRVEVWA